MEARKHWPLVTGLEQFPALNSLQKAGPLFPLGLLTGGGVVLFWFTLLGVPLPVFLSRSLSLVLGPVFLWLSLSRCFLCRLGSSPRSFSWFFSTAICLLTLCPRALLLFTMSFRVSVIHLYVMTLPAGVIMLVLFRVCPIIWFT